MNAVKAVAGELADRGTKLLKSRQFWSLVALFVINGVEGVREFIPADYLPLVNAALGLLAVWFRLAPRQQF